MGYYTQEEKLAMVEKIDAMLIDSSIQFLNLLADYLSEKQAPHKSLIDIIKFLMNEVMPKGTERQDLIKVLDRLPTATYEYEN